MPPFGCTLVAESAGATLGTHAHLNDLAGADVLLFHQICAAEHVSSEMIKRRYRLAAQTLTYKVDVFPFDILDHHYLHLGEEV